MTDMIWKNKLVTWLHKPAENSFGLLTEPCGGKQENLKILLKGLETEIGLDWKPLVEVVCQAEKLAKTPDKPQWARNTAEVDFSKDATVIHPLTEEKITLNSFPNTSFIHLKEAVYSHFAEILKLGRDAKMKYLALWRFAPELRGKFYGELGAVWPVLPADTRVPNNSIWNHLDLTSAFAGAKANGEEPALLAMSFGPVQSFIAQARASSDLWAGSHLLSSIVWEAMKIVAEEVGPDAFLFPQIRGLAIVDLWLLEMAEKAGLSVEWKDYFKSSKAEWLRNNNNTDSNPLFAASLPNKFSAIVPASKAQALAEKIVINVRKVVKSWAIEALNVVSNGKEIPFALEQLHEQLEDFPNIYWSVVDWKEDISESSDFLQGLKEATNNFVEKGENFFNSEYWKAMNQTVKLNGQELHSPSAGLVYPAVYNLSEKSLATAKALRSFKQLPQEGFRCTLCGEREWLSDSKEDLCVSPGKRRKTLWARSYAPGCKKEEHLCAICALKRFWPMNFIDKIRQYLPNDDIRRYVISTHTMSLVPTLDALADKDRLEEIGAIKFGDKSLEDFKESVALPRKLYKKFRNMSTKELNLVKKIPAYVDYLRNIDFKLVDKFQNKLKSVTGVRPETYYALILMDGDNMGAWLSATDKDKQVTNAQSWHPKIVEQTDKLLSSNPELKAYRETYKTATPTRHAAISQALNTFSSMIVPDIIENDHSGKLLYSGGDDVLAMAPTDDVIPIILELRKVYSGIGEKAIEGQCLSQGENYADKGFMLFKNRLVQTMGTKATASVGVVIVHSQTPLAYALKCLREAEQRAKSAGRNAFCIRILKRGGGEIGFTDTWGDGSNAYKDSTMALFNELVGALANIETMSRKAFYALEEWLHLLPIYSTNWKDEEWSLSRQMASAMLGKQFKDHGASEALAKKVVDMLWDKAKDEKNKKLRNPIKQLESLLFSAEFFARETRTYKIVKEAES